MRLEKGTADAIKKFAATCRTGEYEEDIPGVSSERAGVYRNLIFDGVEDTLRKAYPITFALLSLKPGKNSKYKNLWEELTNRFFSGHESSSPELWRMPYFLYEFARQCSFAEYCGIPFVEDLLYFEWIEIEVHMMEDLPIPFFVAEGNPRKDKWAATPEFRIIQLTYPVHRAEHFGDCSPGNYFVLCFRNLHSKEVHFCELSPMSVLIAEQLGEGCFSLNELSEMVLDAAELSSADASRVNDEALTILQDLKDAHFILGFSVQETP